MHRYLYSSRSMLLAAVCGAAVPLPAADPDNPPMAVVTFSDQATHPSGSQAPGEQFILFGANAEAGTPDTEDPAANLHKLEDFDVTVLPGRQLVSPRASEQEAVNVIAPGGTLVRTGLLATNQGSEDYVDMVSFRLVNPAVTSFSVWVLDSTIRQKGNANDGLAIRVNGAAPQAARETAKTDLSNQFTKFTVTGASMSDVFTVSVRRQETQHTNYRTLAGLTFSATPDPALAGKKFPVIEQDGWLDLNKNGKKDAYEDPTVPLEKRVEDLLSQMTMEEKLGQLNQLVVPGDGKEKDAELFPLMRRGEVSSYIWGRGVPATRNQFQRIAVQESRLGIPIIFGIYIILLANYLFRF